jgi:chorismate-pyruvate lyase
MLEPSGLVDSSEASGGADLPLLYPLTEFYREAGLPIPSASPLSGAVVPEPYRSLLVHDRDMTPTLEKACGCRVNLRVLKYSHQQDVFSRQIVLIPEASTTPVVFGAIVIYLEHFSAEARRLVLDRKLPFGTILQSQGIEHYSRPDAFFEVSPDAVIGAALELADERASGRLYGRRNVLWGSSYRRLARVLEILPPA